MDFRFIELSLEEGVATVTLNRPDRLNALTRDVVSELRAALRQAGEEGARALLLTGAGRGFSAGADLKHRLEAKPEDTDSWRTLDEFYNPLVRELTSLPMPTVAAVNGPCAGAGMSLALACDIVLAADSATFLQAFCRIGLVPDAGSTWFLPRQIGRARAAGMALLGEGIPAETAEAWGLIWRCVPDEALMAEARAVAQKLASGPTVGLNMIRRALRASPGSELSAQLDLERDLQDQASRSEDFREGVRAFAEKRAPRFQGR